MICLLFVKLIYSVTKLNILFQWSVLDYYFPNEQIKLDAILSGKYVAENNLPVGIEIWREKLFITVPRWRPGIILILKNAVFSTFNNF